MLYSFFSFWLFFLFNLLMHGRNKGRTYLSNLKVFSLSVYDILLPPCIMRLIITFTAEFVILLWFFEEFFITLRSFCFREILLRKLFTKYSEYIFLKLLHLVVRLMFLNGNTRLLIKRLDIFQVHRFQRYKFSVSSTYFKCTYLR